MVDVEIGNFLVNKELDFKVGIGKELVYKDADYVIITISTGYGTEIKTLIHQC